MHKINFKKSLGIALIEALIAFSIIGVGMLSLAKLSSRSLQESGQSKARMQAIQLAESKLSEIRTMMVKSQFTSHTSLSESSAEQIYGYSGNNNASTQFKRWWTVANNGADARTISVRVAWTDRSNNTQTVEVNTVVSWNDPGSSTALSLTDPDGGGAGTYATIPTGRAKLGSGTVAVDNTYQESVEVSYGVRQQKSTTGESTTGEWLLVDDSGNVLLTATNKDEKFSVISGNVYIDQNNLSAIKNNEVYVVISDASYCAMLPSKTANPVNPLTNLGNGSIYKYFSYRCYLGANWYGSIGVVRTDSANTNDRICVGDPAVSYVASNLKVDNRHPALGTSRVYRGYAGTSPYYKSTGVGIQSGSYTPATYNGHDFLLSRITGNPSDADCGTKMQLYDTTSPYEPFSTDATVHTPDTETAYLYGGNTKILGNPGKFFCFTTNCPDNVYVNPPEPVTIHINVSIALAKDGSDSPSITSLRTNSGACIYANSTKSYDCEFTGAGFTGGKWNGSLIVNTGNNEYICSKTTTGTASPLPSAPHQPQPNTFTFEFVDQNVDAGNATFGFTVGKTLSSCQ